MFRQFDIIQIITTKGIKYLSGPEGHTTSPHGNWSIVGFVGPDAILAKENTLVRVPLTDIKKIASYDTDLLLEQLTTAGYVKSESISMSNYISTKLDINIAEARTLLIEHDFKLNVKTENERDTITEKVQKLWLKNKKK